MAAIDVGIGGQLLAATAVDVGMGGQLLAQPLGDKAWSSGTCACLSDTDSCCLSCWCPPIQFGQNQERAFRAERRGCCRWALVWTAPLFLGWLCLEMLHLASGAPECTLICHDAHGEHRIDSAQDMLKMDEATMSCVKSCPYPAWVDVLEVLVWIASGLAIAIIAGRRRTLLRTQHRIGGSLEQDVMCHCLCGCCSLAQEARQIAHEEMVALRAEPSGVPHAVAAAAYAPAPLGRVPNGYAEAAPTYEQATALPALAQPLAQPVYSLPSGPSSY